MTLAASQPDPLSWYVVQTRSNLERRVADGLALKSFEAYLPAAEEIHTWSDRKKLVHVPVFPGYVFVRFRLSPQAMVAVLRTNGVVRILGNGQRPESVPEIEVESVRKLLQSRAAWALHPFLKSGSVVRVTRGPLTGAEGILVRFKNRARLVLTVTLLGQAVSTEVDYADVEVIRAAPALSAAPGAQSWPRL